MFMGANALWFQPITHVSIGEAMCLLSAIEWMQALNFKHVIFSLDSKIIVDSFNSSLLSFYPDIIALCYPFSNKI